jgi:hypothetical protein
MSCPFLDPSMLARIPAEKREEMKEQYHKLKKEEGDHLKIDIKDEDVGVISPEDMMKGMTGGAKCPIGDGGSGGSENTDFSSTYQDDPQAFMERMS